jgi:hypothetical protein
MMTQDYLDKINKLHKAGKHIQEYAVKQQLRKKCIEDEKYLRRFYKGE